jgi:hypothetical protein
MISTVKKLLAEKGILSSPKIKPYKVLPPKTAEIVREFYVWSKQQNIPGTNGNLTQKARRLIFKND